MHKGLDCHSHVQANPVEGSLSREGINKKAWAGECDEVLANCRDFNLGALQGDRIRSGRTSPQEGWMRTITRWSMPATTGKQVPRLSIARCRLQRASYRFFLLHVAGRYLDGTMGREDEGTRDQGTKAELARFGGQ